MGVDRSPRLQKWLRSGARTDDSIMGKNRKESAGNRRGEDEGSLFAIIIVPARRRQLWS
jgi:hypothetical protein